MRPEDVPEEWIEKAAEELIGSWDGAWISMEIARQMAADALAAVLPEAQDVAWGIGYNDGDCGNAVNPYRINPLAEEF